MAAAEEHVHHLVRRNEGLQAKIDKLKAKGSAAAKHGVDTLEIMAGAALGGLLEGMAKDQVRGPRLLGHIPADFGLGVAALAIGAFDVAGDYSNDVSNVGKGLLASFASSFGHSIGERKRVSGTFFPKTGLLGPATKASGEPTPHQVADAILQQMAR